MKLADYLKANGLSLAAFAAEVAVSEAAMSRYAAGKRMPRKEILRRIVRATGGRVEAGDLIPEAAAEAPTGAPAGVAAGVTAWLAARPEIREIELLLIDLAGTPRGKRVPRDALAKVMTEGSQIPSSVFALDIHGANVAGTGLVWSSGDPDRPIVAAAEHLIPAPWADDPFAQLFMTMREADGRPFYGDPRNVLVAQIERFRELALAPVLALELEFYLFDAEPDERGRPRPPRLPRSGWRARGTHVYGLEPLVDFAAFLAEVRDACAEQGVPIEGAVAEYAPAQFEINLRHGADVLAACDQAILLKRTVKEVAKAHDLAASFMAKPYQDQAGSGLHVHLSAVDGEGRNLFDGGGPGEAGLSVTLRHAIGGLTATMADFMAVFAPNGNSYRRLRPGSYAPLAPCWGIDNRTVAVRVPSGPGHARRFEHRVAGADANPYLAVAAILAGVHHGISGRLDPGPRTTGNAYEKLEPSLPTRWHEALDRFAGSALVEAYFGAEFRHLYATVKGSELDHFERTVTAVEHDWYLPVL